MAAPSENAPLSSLVSNSPSGDAVSQKPPDATLTHPSAPSPSQLKTRSISGESSSPGRPPSTAILDPPRETLPPEHSQLGEMTGTLGGSRISPAPSPVDPIVPLSPSSQVPAPTAESEREPEGPLATSSTPYASETFPHFIPLPESDVEEESSSESPKVERFERTWNSGDQDRGAYTTDINERTNTPDRPDVHRITHPSRRFPTLESSVEGNMCPPR
ncbi:hypothetical protein BC826DRAFT_121377 [Russula brevipes]|nr:hypothetical protein BC826DRAFT_121377 [Russula brevipes]